MDDPLLDEQRQYYRRRAPECDQWWQRRGRYALDDALAASWQAEVDTVAAAVDAFGATGDVLEIAGGTGWWTPRLAASADRLTVLDSSPETLDINRSRVRDVTGREDVEYVEYVVADVFDWRPPRRYDAVFFSFWLSHVPRDRFGAFWTLVRDSLVPGGRVFLIDNTGAPAPGLDKPDPYVVRYDTDVQHRDLGDGSQWRVVKIMYDPAGLNELLSREGWDSAFEATEQFVFGTAVPR